MDIPYKGIAKIQVQAAVTVAALRMGRSLLIAAQGYSVLPLYLCKNQIQQGYLTLLHRPSTLPTNSLYLTWNRGNLRHPCVAFACQYLLKPSIALATLPTP